jgi:hypothetical protein
VTDSKPRSSSRMTLIVCVAQNWPVARPTDAVRLGVWRCSVTCWAEDRARGGAVEHNSESPCQPFTKLQLFEHAFPSRSNMGICARNHLITSPAKSYESAWNGPVFGYYPMKRAHPLTGRQV